MHMHGAIWVGAMKQRRIHKSPFFGVCPQNAKRALPAIDALCLFADQSRLGQNVLALLKGDECAHPDPFGLRITDHGFFPP